MYVIECKSDNGKSITFGMPPGPVIAKASGLTENSVRFAKSQGVTQIGTSVQAQSVEDRPIIINGVLVGESKDLRKQLIDTIVPQVPVTLVFNHKLEIKVLPQITPLVEQKPFNAAFQLTFLAPYPYWRTIEKTVVDLAGMVGMFSFPINYGDPPTHMFGKRAESFFKNVENKGNVAAPFIVRFIAQTTTSDPEITKVDTLESLRILKTMQAGEIITIDMTQDPMRVESMYQGKTIDVFNYFDIDSDVFMLDVGDNIIRFDAGSNREGLDCRITVQPAFSGAYGDDSTYF